MKDEKKKYLLVLMFLIVLNLIPHIYASFSRPGILLNWYLTDDAFYYFKTAQNIAEGRGITFDGLSPTNGFHPLWMAICVPVFSLARFDLYLPLRILVVIQGILNAMSGYFLYRILGDRFSCPFGLLAASLWMFLPSIHAVTTKLGLETGINALSIFVLIFLVSKFLSNGVKDRRPSIWLIGLAGVICLFSRLDNIFIIGLIGIWLVFHDNQISRYAMLDFFLITFSVLLGYFLRIQKTDNILNFLPFAYTLLISSLVIKSVVLYLFKGYSGIERKKIGEVVLFAVLSIALSSALISILVFLLFDVFDVFMGYSRSVLALDFLFSLIFLTGVRIFRWRRCRFLGCEEVDISFKSYWQEWLSRAAAFFLPVLGFLAVYMAINTAYAGSAMPVSGKIKHWWGKLPHTIYGRPIKTLSGVLNSFFDPDRETGPFWFLARSIERFTLFLIRFFDLPGSSSSAVTNFISAMIWFALAAGLLMLIYRYRDEAGKMFNQVALPALAVGCFIHILSYRASGYLHARYWYWLGEMIFVFLFLAIIIGIALSHISKRTSSVRIINLMTVILAVIPYLYFGTNILRDFPLGPGGIDQYGVEEEKRFIQRYTEPGDVVGMTGGGLLGYFIPDRTFVNLDGLINSPRYYKLMKDDQARVYLEEINLKYVYGDGAALLDSDPFRWIFTGKLFFMAKGPYFWLYRY